MKKVLSLVIFIGFILSAVCSFLFTLIAILFLEIENSTYRFISIYTILGIIFVLSIASSFNIMIKQVYTKSIIVLFISLLVLWTFLFYLSFYS